MAVNRDEVVGRPTGAATIHIERGPVSQFAMAVKDSNPIYRDIDAARKAGFDGIPAPPTFTFAIVAEFFYDSQSFDKWQHAVDYNNVIIFRLCLG